MTLKYNETARRLGVISAIVVIILLIVYSITLIIGFMSLKSQSDQIGDPMFSILEILIITMMPAIVVLFVSLYAWTPENVKIFSLISLIFMSLLAGVTMSLHFVILSVSRHYMFSKLEWIPLFTSFTWPSVAYALDILAWDVLYSLSMLFGALSFSGSRLKLWIRISMVTSGVLALAGLSGVVVGDMMLRNIGIVGYVPVFLVVLVLFTLLFCRDKLFGVKT